MIFGQHKETENYKHWTTEEDAKLKELIVGNYSFKQIAEILKKNYNSCRNRCYKTLKIKLNKTSDWTDEENHVLINNFDKFEHIYDLCSLLKNRNYNSIKARAKYLGLIKHIDFIKNEKFFEIPNTINSSVAGMIASDGHIKLKYNKKSSSIISIGLSVKDRQILDDIKAAANSNCNICERRQKTYVRCRGGKLYHYDNKFATLLFSNSQKWIDDISKNWNIPHGRKSLIIEPPLNLNIENSLAYIVGIINGDGTIYIQKSSAYFKYVSICLLGTEKLLNWCKFIMGTAINKEIRGKVRRERAGANVFSLKITGINAILLFEKFNKLNVIKLNRKWGNPDVLALIEEQKIKSPYLFISQNPAQSVKPVAITNLN